MYKIIKLSMLLFFVFFNSISFTETIMTANEIMLKSEKVYANCKSYKDNGLMRSTFTDKDRGRKHIENMVFSTVYIRPEKFRFEFAVMKKNKPERQYIIWKKNQTVKSYWEVNRRERTHKLLSSALYIACGVSHSLSLHISNLLIPEVNKGRLLTRIDDPLLITEKKDESGITCYVIDGNMEINDRTLVWVQKETFLISKIEEYFEKNNYEVSRVTAYDPQVNIKIQKKCFKFKRKCLIKRLHYFVTK